MSRSETRNSFLAVLAAACPVGVAALLLFGIPWALNGASLVRVYGVMAIAFVALLASAIGLHRFVFRIRGFLVSCVAALVTVCVVWVWQRIAFNLIIPNGFLEYGYSLKADGARARSLFLELPFTTGSILLLLLLVAGITSAWRSGARWSCGLAPVWWSALYCLFSLPYIAWSIQGDASVFI